MTFKVPEANRVRHGRFGSSAEAHGNNGLFVLPPLNPLSKMPMRVIASDELGWEHVSVSLQSRCPTWDEMCHVKALFWDDEDCVMQLHPPKSRWISNHRYCLHLWRPTHHGCAIPTPPDILVGIQSMGVLA